MGIAIKRDMGWFLDKIAIFGHDREAQLKLMEKFERTIRSDSIREASKVLLDHKHESTTGELIDMLDELADKAEES